MISHKLIIAEKPSVAQSIASVLGATQKQDGYMEGNGYLVSWCVGHLVELVHADQYDEKYAKWNYGDLPIIPDDWKYTVASGKQKQFKILKDLMHDDRVSSIVCATDAGREGELIFRFVYHQAHCKKPIERLWISSMEDSAIAKGFENLRPGQEYEKLYASALCRAQADWLVGINATRLFSVLYNATLNVGRVQSPTLAMLVQRHLQIANFQKEKYFHAHIDCDGIDAISGKITERSEAERIQTACHGGQAVVTAITKEQKTVNPPKLYDLTTLQREANRLYGFTAQQTLDYTQSLYEKKLVTYPRTDSNYITDDMTDSTVEIITEIFSLFPFANAANVAINIKNLVNNSKVTDHHAIIPTMEITKADLDSIPATEKSILTLISMRLLCAVSEKHSYEAVTATFDCSGYAFTAKGKTTLQDGWKSIETAYKNTVKTAKDNTAVQNKADNALPPLLEQQVFDEIGSSVSEHFTNPPKSYTEDTLLSAMENADSPDVELHKDAEKKGLGTPATRAAVIEKLVTSGFMERKNKQLLPTEKGINLIAILPDTIKSAKLTAEWENALTEIAQGRKAADDFMNGITAMVKELVQTHTSATNEGKALFQTERICVGKCPRCGSNVYEGKKNFYCSNKECSFTMWKNDKFFSSKKKELTARIAETLLNSGKILVKGLYSEKKDTKYDAYILLADTGGKYVNYKLEFLKRRK